MTSSELKYLYEEANPTGHFFDRKTMKFFGDTMKNFGVTKVKLKSKSYPGLDLVDGYVLYRKKPVKHGLHSVAYSTIHGKQAHNVESI